MNEVENKEPKVYSYHTFYFPFVWNENWKITFEDVVSMFDKDKRWKGISVTQFSDVIKEKPNKKGEEKEEKAYQKVAEYQSIQYFTPAARRSLFGWDKKYVKCFSFNLPKESKYHILHKWTEPKDKNDKKKGVIEHEQTWDLVLDGIRLKIYNTGIAVLTIETENYSYKTMKDVKAINEYGRRIFAPFLTSNGCPICAHELGIQFGNDGVVSYSNIATDVPKCEEDCVPSFIKKLMPAELINVKPAIDDRMFVACILIDSKEFEMVMKYDTDEKQAENLYEFLYVDRDDNCSCPTRSMRKELIEKSVYRRWIENKCSGNIAGSLYGVTHHSFMCITTEDSEAEVQIPFLVIYTHIVSAVIAQRGAILAFDNIVSELSCDFEKPGNSLNGKKVKQLQELQEQYIAFLNQHMNIELTNQEQGIELYEMFHEELYIKEEIKNLENEIQALSNAADTQSDRNLNTLALKVTLVLLFVEPIISIVYNYIWEVIRAFWKF